ncbi:MAG: hypothetical protein WC346_20610, partial [Methanogenium sp.]
ELKRSNPPRYDKRKDIYQNVNENLRDSDVSNRFDQTSLTSGANKKLSFNKTSVDINEWLETGIPFAYKRDSKKLYVGKRGQSHGELGKQLYDHGLKFTLNTNSYSYYPSDEEFLLGRVNSTKTKVGFYAKEDDGQINDCLFELLRNNLIIKDTLVYLDEMFSYNEEGKSVREIFSSAKLSWKLSPQEEQNPLYGENVKKWTTKYLGINKIVDDYIYWVIKTDQRTIFDLDIIFQYIKNNNLSKQEEDIIYTVIFEGRKPKLGELNPPPGFIPTNKGMMTEEDIIDDLSYSSYAANRDYDRYIEPYSTIPNPDYDFEKSRVKWRNFWMKAGGWSEDKLNRFERRYFIETGGK